VTLTQFSEVSITEKLIMQSDDMLIFVAGIASYCTYTQEQQAKRDRILLCTQKYSERFSSFE